MEDIRIKHTKKRIKNAMIEILKTTSLDKVSVKGICEIAEVNRSTFYTYYLDSLSLYQEMENEWMSGFNSFVNELKNNSITYKQFILNLVDYIDKNGDSFLTMSLTNSESYKKINQQCLSNYNDLVRFNEESTKEYYLEFVRTGIQNILIKWVKKGKVESKDYIAKIIYDFTYKK